MLKGYWFHHGRVIVEGGTRIVVTTALYENKEAAGIRLGKGLEKKSTETKRRA